MTLKEVDRHLLLIYLDGNCSGDQLQQIKKYFTDEAYRDSLNKFMQEEWKRLGTADFSALPAMPEQYAKFRFYLAYREKRAVNNKSTNVIPVQRSRVRRLYALAAVAAVVLLLLVSTWILRALNNRRHVQQTAARELYFHNEPGHKTTIELPDSSRVYLGVASTLRFKQDEEGNRIVLLEGQAYFEVKHDERRSFTVRTGSITTVDMGTAFNIRYYPGDPSIEVAVTSGKVQVLKKGDQANTPFAVLDQGMHLEYDPVTQRYGITSFTNTDGAGAWRKGVLSFHKQRLKVVTDELQRYYGVRFQYTDMAAENILMTTVLDNKSVEEALDIVTLTAGISFTRQGNEIILK